MSREISGETPWSRVRRIVPGSAPAAGADWTLTVPAGKVWRIRTIEADLVTSATVADRSVALSVSDGSTTFVRAAPAAVQAASLTRHYCWWANASALAFGSSISQPIPELVVPAGYVIAVATDNIDAGDQWAAPVLYVTETTVKGGPVELDELPELYVQIVNMPGM